MARPKALTSAQAAKLAGLAPASFRREMSRQRERGFEFQLPPEQWPDKRTPLWDGTRLATWLKSRPGPGYWGPRARG